MQAFDHVIDLVGNTPLVRITPTIETTPTPVLAKLEYLNPGGSVKDRVALTMVSAAEEAGLLPPGGTIIEPTSGNTGVGLALVAARRGYRCVFTMPDKISEEKRAVLRAYGAEVVICPTAVAPDDPRSYYSVARRLVRETPGGWSPDQYSNPNNPAAHYATTGPEIWQATNGRVTHFVAGIGTGGTISGVGRYLKEASGGTVQIVGADPEGSVYSGGSGRPYLVEGVGEDIWPTTYDKTVVDRVEAVSDRDSFLMTRELARKCGLLVGGSGGLAVVVALRVARELGPDDAVVVLLPDSGRGYLSKIFNDEWMYEYGFLEPPSNEPTVSDVLRNKAEQTSGPPDLVHVHPAETVGAAISYLREYNVSQMPVVRHEPPLRAAEVAGSVIERHLLAAVFADRSAIDAPVADHLSPSLPMVGTGEPLARIVAVLGDEPAVLVHDEGNPVGILTRADLLSFLAVR
ncbi:cystathionine beta-synthase [Frankia casuarinae]|nr:MULTISPECIES: cystathionine beta-synthase [Frankia]ETA02257.1 cystathionine beta-synthase [Frankia sp. CcI6]EYT93004.1 cystathionine beta-synthase [Frankia casuarinae]KDA43291.1 cystathionine beta-synthase [Frankia sp. BMG5.23]KEZ36745.1 cystathionine beta-synthase [Frankia sp. CeD]OHV54789.1 cystathionine beta-synthase [Frankia sp. CgIS1]